MFANLAKLPVSSAGALKHWVLCECLGKALVELQAWREIGIKQAFFLTSISGRLGWYLT